MKKNYDFSNAVKNPYAEQLKEGVNLFWETRKLTQAREDHLTSFIAAALEVDYSFRQGYECCVLGPLSDAEVTPRIRRIETQVSFRDEARRPDMILHLADSRIIACEHKLEAPETKRIQEDGTVKGQIEDYLALPGVSHVAYFRSMPIALPRVIIDNDRYLHPRYSDHFLWRDLYHALSEGKHAITRWLFEGFEKLGFTPPVVCVGKLWPHFGKKIPSHQLEEVKESQRNFAKLWHKTRSYASPHWTVQTGARCELYFRPRSHGAVSRIYVSPLAQGATLLRFRTETNIAQLPEVAKVLKKASEVLPVEPVVHIGKLPNGLPIVDLLASLHLVIGAASTPEHQEEKLFAQVVPMLDALLALKACASANGSLSVPTANGVY